MKKTYTTRPASVSARIAAGSYANQICIATSSGGHLSQILLLRPWWSKKNRFFVSFDKPGVRDSLGGETLYWAHGPEHGNVINAFKNFCLALRILSDKKTSLVFSMGAGIAPPFFAAAKILGIKTLYIEPYDFATTPSASAVISSFLVDELLVQHRGVMSKLRRGKYRGAII